MRLAKRTLPLPLLTAAVVTVLALGCNESNTIAGPASDAAANVSGAWSGTYRSNNPALCGAAPAEATLQQNGSQVSGIFKADSCGIAGSLRGTVHGNDFVGSVNMLGCTGGAVSGKIDAGGMNLSVGDFYKPLVTGEQEILPGGAVTLRR